MKKLHLLVYLLCFSTVLSAQNVGIGTTTPNSKAALEIRSNDKGVLMPRLSSTARNAMTNVPKGMMVYDSTFSAFYYHDGNKWRPFAQQNTDSMVKDYSGTTEVTQNMPSYASNTTTTANSGLLYDNGGPSANYSHNALDAYGIQVNDSTVGFRIIVEQLNLDIFDSLILAVGNDDYPIQITATGTYTIPATSLVAFIFKSNATVSQAGFRIRWTRIVATKDPSTIPSFGWYYDLTKQAARGGISSNNNWASDSLGKFSMAFGNNVYAKGMNAFSFGENAFAPGKYSLAFGYKTKAMGENAVAIGQETEATDGMSFALGWKTKATSFGAIAMGTFTTASGERSFATGNNSLATGGDAVAIGGSAQATARAAVAIGSNAVGSGNYTLAIGHNAKATAENGSSSFGNETLASALSATAIGDNTTASGSYSSAFGYKAMTTGSRAVAFGTEVTARSFASTALGYNNNPVNTSSQSAWNLTDPLLIIGNGTSASATSNALMILKNGNTGIGTNAPSTKLHIAGGTDANLTAASGYLVIGDVAGTNIVFDNNEIQARNNSAVNTLYLQNAGGAFEVGGSAAKPGGGSWSATSDARLKQDVKPYEDGLQQLLQINPVYYHYNNQSGYDTAKQHIGVIAQDLQTIAPYMVNSFEKAGTDYLKVDNSAMTYMLINAVKEQQEMISKQQQQIDELKKLLQQKSTSHK